MMTEFEKACRTADLKVTHQRLEVYRELLQAEDHPSAEMLYKRIIERLPTISLDTVYRTLSTLEKHGLITRVQTVESQARFEATMARHHHAVCSKCGAITDFTWNSFDEVPVPAALNAWGKVAKRNAILEGICNDCSPKN
ncbi:MAG: transcriptional repressor [Proteobacteria bacterium]|nr:transcriptional repressor [Pseudomonadota bacterium]MBU1233279.1 transcriptional repressor [Pseudomonadota bacterium]MBU1418251.1 transcriptional repressor [Pseudomonadota bacterium]MBU1453345.1 transcriptional repressor [Pseudomonadota bacterium]